MALSRERNRGLLLTVGKSPFVAMSIPARSVCRRHCSFSQLVQSPTTLMWRRRVESWGLAEIVNGCTWRSPG